MISPDMPFVRESSSGAARRGPTLLIRADAGGLMGVGHVMRMLALAQAWLEQGGEARLAFLSCPEMLATRLAGEGVRLDPLTACAAGSAADSSQTIELARACAADWVVLDGYSFGLPMQTALHEAGLRVMVMDDYGHSAEWCADAILNQNFDAVDRSYANRQPDAIEMKGPRYALLRREFRMAGETVPDAGDRCKVLVTLGGVDAGNLSARVLTSFEAADVPTLSLRVLAGPGNPHHEMLTQLAAASRHRVELVRDCPDMPAMYLWADAVVSAAGSTCYEWLRFTRPAAVVIAAENQKPIAAWLRQHHAATVLPDDVPAAALTRWLHSGPTPPPDLVDAQGAFRVVDHLLAAVKRPIGKEVCHA